MAEEHHMPRKYGFVKNNVKVNAAVWPYFEEDGSIRWQGTATHGEVVLLHVLKATSDTSARQLLASKLSEAAGHIQELIESLKQDIRRV